jgi:hypothetical protein
MSGVNQSIEIPSGDTVLTDGALPAGVATVATIAGVERPARQAVVGSVSGSIVLTRPDGTEITISAARLNKRNGIVMLEFVALKSAACTDIEVAW